MTHLVRDREAGAGAPRFVVARRMAVRAALLVGTVTALAPESRAIPTWSRKYDTSCSSCHTVYPELNPFGEVFRRSGYRWPGGVEAQGLRTAPVEIGATDGNRMGGLLLSTIPDSIPISVQFLAEAPIVREKTGSETSTNFQSLLDHENFYTGGTLSERLSFFANLGFSVAADEPGHSHGDSEPEPVYDATPHFHRIFGNFNLSGSPLANFRFGYFEPGMFLSSSHRHQPFLHPIALTRTPVGANKFTIEESQAGGEVHGVFLTRAFYSVGLVEGRTAGQAGVEPVTIRNNEKDYYARVGWKFGGLPLDGTMPEGGPSPHETSIMASLFHYRGETTIQGFDQTFTTELTQDNEFHFTGAELENRFGPLQVNVGGYVRWDEQPGAPVLAFTTPSGDSIFGLDPLPGVSRDSYTWFATAHYALLPYLAPFVQIEHYQSETTASDHKVDRLSGGINFLLHTNAILYAAYGYTDEDNSPTLGDVTTDAYYMGARLAF